MDAAHISKPDEAQPRLRDSSTLSAPITDPIAAAKAAHLIYVHDEWPGIRRKRVGTGFAYTGPDGRPVRDPEARARIRSLAIPPAYEDVWICPDPNGHIQATGRDARGCKQYRYHPRWREIRDANKYEEMIEFGRLLPQLRARIAADMAKRGLSREKVLATIVELLQSTLIRIGNDDYARENKSYGLTTLRNRHVAIEGNTLRFEFKGKSGKIWKLKLHDRRIARIVKACHDLPGQALFQYFGEDGKCHSISSSDVNAYLKEISGHDITAKHFRTWAGTLLAATAIGALDPASSLSAGKKKIKAVIEEVAKQLGNTPTICRKCYVHPEVIAAYLENEVFAGETLDLAASETADGLKPEERQLLAFLDRRLKTQIGKIEKAA
jgi:DNA topoisomerase I